VSTKSVALTSLTKFLDPLHIPPTLRPRDGSLQMRICAARVRLHTQLPPSEVWTYGGELPGPTIEVRRGQRLNVVWTNDLPVDTSYPVVAVTAPDGTQNDSGLSERMANELLATLPAWAVTHLHGGRTAAQSDGWTENCILSGQSSTMSYSNDQRATTLWYHDHAMGITRLNVYAGLAGLYVIRDDEEDALGLPHDRYEIPLVIQDRNLDTDCVGALTGRLLHKTEDSTMEFFGPFTLVNGRIWPHLDVEARQYRLRVINCSNARIYRLVFLDDKGESLVDCIRQIGSEGGLFGRAVEPPVHGLTLAPAERADLIVDFGRLRGERVTLVNTATAPFDGAPPTERPGIPVPDKRLPHPEVMQFRVAVDPVGDSFTLPPRLSAFERWSYDTVPRDARHRIVGLVEYPPGMLTLRELEAVPEGTGADAPLIGVVDDRGVATRYRTVAQGFEDKVNWFVGYGETEVWSILNLTEDTHPFHVHLVNFQVLGRDQYDVSGFSPEKGRTNSPVAFKCHGTLDTNEMGFKDTVRVNPGELVAIAARFDGYTGRYMYHCHILEHEDHEMMRPFVVMPRAVIDAMAAAGMAM
jgi:FtsP/CotA-like multicopper oxidase with cupredoxin domain